MSVAGNIVVELQLDNDKMIVGVKQAGAVLRQFQTTLGSTSAVMKKTEAHTDSLGDKFRNIVMTLGNLRFVAMDINDVFLRLPVAIMKTAGELERTQVLLSGLSKEMSKAARDAEGAANFSYITKMAQSAPFEISQLSDAFVKFKTAGIDPTNGSMQALVDSVAKFGGTGESLKRASVAIQQMSGKGVVSMEELRQQLGEAVPTAMQDMATGMGMSMAALTAAVSKGTVEASDAINKMLVVMAMRNGGAAKEMMQTWTGIMAQLKTQTDLAFKDMADSGFGDATKRAAVQISAALNSVEFKQFSDSAGSSLGNLVDSLTTISRTLVENIDLIKTAAAVWLSYKVASATIGPTTMGVADAIKKVSEEYKSQIATRTRDLEKARAVENEKITLANAARTEAAASAQAEVAASQAKIAAMRTELAERQQNAVKIRQNYADTAQALKSYQVNAKIGDQHLPVNRDDVQAYARNLARLEAENARAMRAIKTEILATEAAHKAAAASVITHTGAITSLNTSAVQASRSIALMSSAANIAGKAFDFLGGWATVLNIALAAGVYAWANWGKAAEDAALRASRARKGIANQEDLDGLLKTEQGIVDERAQLERSINYRKERGQDKENSPQYKLYQKDMEALDALNQKALKAAELRSQAQVSVNRENSRLESESILRDSDLKIAGLKATATKERAAIEEKYATLIRAAGSNQAKVDALLKQQSTDMKVNEQASYGKQIEAIKREISAQTSRLGGSDADSAVAAIQSLNERLAAAQSGAASVAQAMGENKFIAAKKTGNEGKSKNSPVDDLIERMRANRLGLEAELQGLDSTTAKADKIAGIIAELDSKFKSGQIKDADGKTPSLAKRTAAIQEAVDEQRAKDNLKDAETNAEQIKKVADYIESMRPELDAAKDLMQDPFGTAQRGAGEKRADRWIGKNQEAVKKYADSLNITVEQAEASIRKMGTDVDDAQTFSKIAQETKQITDGMVSDARLAARARMQADTEAYRLRIQQIIETRRTAGASEAEIAQMQDVLNKSIAAKAGQTAKTTESPLERLGSQWENTTTNMEEATARWGQSAMDVFTNAALTGKLEFADMARSILADMAKIAMQKAMGSAISSAVGMAGSAASALLFANGGIMNSSGSMPLKKYASGGIARSPQMAIFGEGDMAEAYVPLPDGRSIPVTMSAPAGGAQGGDSVMVQINVTEAGTSNSTASGDTSGFYQQLGERVKSVVQQELATQMRPGGVLAR